ncbi:hypothetical protein BH18ACT14_BH18ACT14_20460 [soil metagenome]
MTVQPRTVPLILLIVLEAACSPAAVKTLESTSSSPIQLPQGSERVTLDPADFVATIDHPFWPMRPGNVWIYREREADGNVRRVKVTVTDGAKRILGIEVTVVRETVIADGELTEDTIDWYAQDTAGNLWLASPRSNFGVAGFLRRIHPSSRVLIPPAHPLRRAPRTCPD